MIILSCNNLTKSFGVDTILENISFSIMEGDKVGIVGINGTGKTTLFKILNGIYGYDSGDIFTSKGCKIGYLEQNTNFQSDNTVYGELLTVFEDVIRKEQEIRQLEKDIANLSKGKINTIELSDDRGDNSSDNKNGSDFDKGIVNVTQDEDVKMDNVDNSDGNNRLELLMEEYASKLESFEKNHGYSYKSEVMGTLRGLGFKDEDMDKPINILSGGEKTRVLLGKLLLTKPTLLMLDEPTNHLDSDAIEWLEGFLRAYDGTVMIISHDRYFLDQSVNRIFEMSNKKLTSYNGNYTQYIEKARQQREIELKNYENQQRIIKKQEESIQRLKSYGREKHVKRARSKEKMLDKIERLEKPMGSQKKARFNFQSCFMSGNDVLKVEGLEKKFDDVSLFKDVEFEIYRGEKVALIGPNGRGKSTIFNILMGEDKNYEGRYKFGQNVKPTYFNQEHTNLNFNNTIFDEIHESNPHFNNTEVRNLLAAFLFTDEDVFKPIRLLSGGEKARVAILKLILSESNMLLLDEPTNHLDIDSKEVLEEALLEYDGTLFTISHDRYFLNTVVDKIIVLSENGVEIYLGNYDYYIEKRNMQREKEALNSAEKIEKSKLEKTKTQIKEEKKKEKEERRLHTQSKKEIEDLEYEIESLEKQIKGLEYMLYQEEVYSSPEKMKEINIEKSDCEKKLERLYAKWEEKNL